ncbi:class I adenylate-forming enzyme family protein [Minwuia sp.]|uniref:class I adenylate-forming enzyme family protein n=1 Tax=Minwuia sp. TaxID=2493630 RepID=UPI003A900B1A
MDLSGWIDGWAAQTPDKAAIRHEDGTLTYAALAGDIQAMAATLERDLGIRSGDRVAHLGENSVAQLTLFFACARLGAILVTLNWRLAPPEHLFQLKDAAPKALFCDRLFFDHVGQIRDQLPGMRFIGIDGTAVGWETLPPGAGTPEAPSPGYDAPVLLVYTSGTTGTPKGAVLTQANVFWNAVNSAHAHDMTSADVILGNLPLFHVGGLNNQLTPALHCGATVLLHPRFDPGVTLAAIERDRPTLGLAVPAMMQALTEHPDWATTDISSLRLIMAGSTTVPTALIQRFHDRKVPVGQIYGSTETCPISVVLRAPDAINHVGSCGKPAIHVRARIVDREGRDLPPGETGELLVRGPNVFAGYWQNEAATEAAFDGDWFRTGDIARVDADGFTFIEDRAKDVIISGGENIYPAELEQILIAHADLAEVAVVGRPDPRWDEVPVIVAVPRAGETVDEAALLGLFHDRLARFKHPKGVVVMDALPRNALGKVLKFELREMLKGS